MAEATDCLYIVWGSEWKINSLGIWNRLLSNQLHYETVNKMNYLVVFLSFFLLSNASGIPLPCCSSKGKEILLQWNTLLSITHLPKNHGRCFLWEEEFIWTLNPSFCFSKVAEGLCVHLSFEWGEVHTAADFLIKMSEKVLGHQSWNAISNVHY